MSLQVSLKQPAYWHHETKNDVVLKKNHSLASSLKEAGTTLLPFAALYRPAAYPLTVATGILRACSFGSALKNAACAEKTNPLALRYLGVQTALSTAALVGTLAAHPLGMMITTGQDIMTEAWMLLGNVKNGNRRAALENALHLVNNAFYMALFLKGGAGLAIASLGLQILNSLYHSITELQKGNKLKAAAHFAMMGLRTSQMAYQIDFYKNPIEVEGDIRQIEKYHYWRGNSTWIKVKESNSWIYLDNKDTANWKQGDHIIVQRIGNTNSFKVTNESRFMSHFDCIYWRC